MISLGQVHEAELTLEKAGATPEFWIRLAQNFELAKATVAFVMNSIFQLVAKISCDMTNWKCLEPVEAEEGGFEISAREFIKEDDNGCCGGEEMLKRAKKLGASSGLRHLEAMLREQEKIPVKLRKFVLVSTEVWQSTDGSRLVWCLYWGGERCYLGYRWLEVDFFSFSRLVASRPLSSKQSLG